MKRRQYGNRTTIPGMASRTTFGHTKNFITNISVENLLNSLSMKALPDHLAELYKDVQRVTTATRVDNFEDYCANHLLGNTHVAGYVPAITVSLSDYDLTESTDGLDVLEFSPSSAFAVDGLGRLNTWMRMLGVYPTYIRGKTAENKSRLQRRLEVKGILSTLEVSVIFVLGAENYKIESRDIGQVFADVNFKQERVKPIHAMKLDTSDPIIQWARELGKLPAIVRAGGVSDDSTRITKNSNAVLTLNTLVRFAQGCIGGMKMQAKSTGAKQLADGTEVNHKYIKNYTYLVEGFLTSWLDEQLNKFGEDKSSYQVNSSLVQSLGLVFYSIYYSYAELGQEKVQRELIEAAKKLAKFDYSRYAEHWKNCNVMEKRERGFVNSSAGGRTFREGLGAYFCQIIGITLKA